MFGTTHSKPKRKHVVRQQNEKELFRADKACLDFQRKRLLSQAENCQTKIDVWDAALQTQAKTYFSTAMT